MARVRDISSTELPPASAAIYERFAASYGPFRNQVAVLAHVPPAMTHLMSMLMELRKAYEVAEAPSAALAGGGKVAVQQVGGNREGVAAVG